MFFLYMNVAKYYLFRDALLESKQMPAVSNVFTCTCETLRVVSCPTEKISTLAKSSRCGEYLKGVLHSTRLSPGRFDRSWRSNRGLSRTFASGRLARFTH